MFNSFNKKEEVINLDHPDKLPGCSKQMIESRPVMELDIPTGCYVSIDPPCEPGALGAREFFQKYGYMIIRGIWDPEEFQEDMNDLPKERGQYSYRGKIDKFVINPEIQVQNSLSRYNHPKYKYAHSQIRMILEDILGEKLYNTYYFDRFYFVNQRLFRHTDRNSCEISLTYQINTNSKEPWGICFQTPDGEEKYVNLNNGDAVLYKGCDIEHWREPLKSRYNLVERLIRKVKKIEDDTFHHQIFFHYVLANGPRSHFAGDISCL